MEIKDEEFSAAVDSDQLTKWPASHSSVDDLQHTTVASIRDGWDATRKAKLDGIEDGATADQTGAEIKAAYEAEADTNAYDDAAAAKLAAIEAGATADQTDAEIRAAVDAATDSNVYDDAAVASVASIAGKLDKPSIVTKSGPAEDLEASDVDEYVRLTNAAAKTYTVPLESTTSIAVESIVTVRNVGVGVATITPEGAVVVNGVSLALAQNATAQLLKVGTDEWDLIG